MHTDLGWAMSATTCPHLVDTATCPTPCRRASEATPGEAMRVLVRRWRACAQSIMPISSDTAQQPPVRVHPVDNRPTAKSGARRWEGLAPLLVFLQSGNPLGDQSKRARICSSCRSRPRGHAGGGRHKLHYFRPPHDDLSRRSAPELPPPEGAHQLGRDGCASVSYAVHGLCGSCLVPARLLATYLSIVRSGRAHASDARCIHDHDHDITLGMLCSASVMPCAAVT